LRAYLGEQNQARCSPDVKAWLPVKPAQLGNVDKVCCAFKARDKFQAPEDRWQFFSGFLENFATNLI